MKHLRVAWLLIVIAVWPAVGAAQSLRLATTTSVRDAGLLDELLPAFESASGLTVQVIAVGSGQAMELGRRGEADILILHDPANEERFVADGYGIEREALMRNEFLLVGDSSLLPALGGVQGVGEAFRRLAERRIGFVSRGDRSGTHSREQSIWRAIGIEPRGTWYRESGQGMGATLQITAELRAATLTDVGTWLSHPARRYLPVIVERDSLLANPYHVILANPVRFPHVRTEAARALYDYLLSDAVQHTITGFRRAELGRSLFVAARAPAN